MITWKHYNGPNSLPEGLYRWSIGNLSFIALNRVRMAGFTNVTSPKFDYWDGYRVTTPEGLRYDEIDKDVTLDKNKVYQCIEIIDGENILPCPFCNTVPVMDFKGLFVGSGPHVAEYFYLKCCVMFNSFGFTFKEPAKLIENWNNKVRRV